MIRNKSCPLTKQSRRFDRQLLAEILTKTNSNTLSNCLNGVSVKVLGEHLPQDVQVGPGNVNKHNLNHLFGICDTII